jgi:hypothetical protein
MQAGQWFAAAENVEEGAEYPRIGGQQHESPFQYRRFRRRTDIEGDEQQGQRGQHKPQQHDAIEHRVPPRCPSVVMKLPRLRDGVRSACDSEITIH